MRYILYNSKTRFCIWFSSRRELHKWIKLHFPLMSYRYLQAWSVHRDIGFTPDNPLSPWSWAYGNPEISTLSNYILSFLKS